MRNGRRLTTLSMTSNTNGNCLSKKSVTSSTEDLWAEDTYLPEQYIVSSPPGFRVSLSTIHQQPEIADFNTRKYFASRPKIPSSLSCEDQNNILPIQHHPRCFNEGDFLLEPPNAFKTPTGSGSSDIDDITTFNTILTSLQGLADSISADFDTLDAENPEEEDDKLWSSLTK